MLYLKNLAPALSIPPQKQALNSLTPGLQARVVAPAVQSPPARAQGVLEGSGSRIIHYSSCRGGFGGHLQTKG